MKILALSDTHLAGPMPAELMEMAKGADLVVHAGDFITIAAYESLRGGCRQLVAVHGNCDAPELRETLPGSRAFEAGGFRFGVVHQGKHATDLVNMRYLALEMGVEALIFGHLHRPVIEKSDVLLVCPGSPIKPRMSDPSVIELIVEKGAVSGSIVRVSTGDLCGSIKFARSL